MTTIKRGSALALLCLLTVLPLRGDDVVLKGEAALKHQLGALALKTAGLMQAGKADDVMKLRTDSDFADWKASSAADRADRVAMMKERAPEPKAYSAAIEKGGELTIDGSRARLIADMPDGETIAFFELEGGKWRIGPGPMVVGGGPKAANETRIEGAEILDHAIGKLALQYADLVHAGKMEAAMQLAGTDAQKKWKALPASEKKESEQFRRSMLPKREALSSGISGGGVLLIDEDNGRATLNVIVMEQTSSEPGVVTSSSTTTAIPFIFEDGTWKLAQ